MMANDNPAMAYALTQNWKIEIIANQIKGQLVLLNLKLKQQNLIVAGLQQQNLQIKLSQIPTKLFPYYNITENALQSMDSINMVITCIMKLVMMNMLITTIDPYRFSQVIFQNYEIRKKCIQIYHKQKCQEKGRLAKKIQEKSPNLIRKDSFVNVIGKCIIQKSQEKGAKQPCRKQSYTKKNIPERYTFKEFCTSGGRHLLLLLRW